MSKNKKIRGYSLKIRIASALLALVIIQNVILMLSITGAIRRNDVVAYSNLSNQSNSRKNEIQNLFNTKKENIINVSMELSNKIEEALYNNDITIDMLAANRDAYDYLLNVSFDNIVDFVKCNSVTGAFVVFDYTSSVNDEEKIDRPCLYIRNSTPGIIVRNNSNLLLKYGNKDIAKQKDIGIDRLWSLDMNFSSEANRDFYFKPVDAALDGLTDISQLSAYGYWSAPFTVENDDTSVITYSLPLVLKDGTVYGVIGFELEASYVYSLMPQSEIPYYPGSYLLGVITGDELYNNDFILSGMFARQFLSGNESELVYNFVYGNEKSSVYEIVSLNAPKNKAVSVYNRISLYDAKSPFNSEKWFLVCMAPKNSVLSGAIGMRNSIIISIASTIILALILSTFIIFYIFSPIKHLSEKVKCINPEKPIHFDRSNISEIDELSGAFEDLSKKISEAAAKMFKIIELVDMPLGSFEINYREKRVHLSEYLLKLLNIKISDNGNVSIDIWDSFINTLEKQNDIKNEEDITEALYTTNSDHDIKKWFRIRFLEGDMRNIGVLIDVTNEMIQKQRLEFERNYDSLTKLFNREAFSNKASELMKANRDKVGIMMFADLDDLKFINDSYGHATGDDYIKSFAGFLNRFKELGAAVGRISGDEFVMFMIDFSSNEEAKEVFYNIFLDLKNLHITTPDGSDVKLRVSVGLSFYPSDSSDIKELIKYADYAMYEIKHKIKGEIQEFNIGSYNKNSFVLNMKDLLNFFIDEKMVRFAFQPIVSVKTGEIYGYESLMRSMLRELKSPEKILTVARFQSKLYQIEKLTFEVIFDLIDNDIEKFEGKKIFINTIPNQVFTKDDMNDICTKYGHLFNQVVFEITENEYSNKEDTKKKMDIFRSYGSMVAIDDYGSGYSNELVLLFIEPDFLKIDMSIVRDIDKDTDRQQLVQNTISYASKRGIKVVAEGVETYEEMEILVRFGVDYIQGYYLAKPDFNILDISEDLKKELTDISDAKKI